MKRLVFTLILILTGCHAASPLPPTTTPAKIEFFENNDRFLSNFWPATVEFEGHTYPTVEHAYQAAKFTDETMRQRVAAAPTPGDAKHIAHTAATQRAKWDQVKFEIMEQLVLDKFTRHPDLRQKLLATGNAELIEGNTWGDQIWGVYNGKGDNRLGKILMKVRAELRQSGAAEKHSMKNE